LEEFYRLHNKQSLATSIAFLLPKSPPNQQKEAQIEKSALAEGCCASMFGPTLQQFFGSKIMGQTQLTLSGNPARLFAVSPLAYLITSLPQC